MANKGQEVKGQEQLKRLHEIADEVRGFAFEVERLDLGNQTLADEVSTISDKINKWALKTAIVEGLQ